MSTPRALHTCSGCGQVDASHRFEACEGASWVSTPPTPYRRTVYLAEGCRPAPDPSRLFRPLADLAHDGYYTPSDLMHDAAWLMAHASGPVVFYWAARSGGGTAIGTDPALVSWPGSGGDSYRVTITHEPRQHWEALIEQVD